MKPSTTNQIRSGLRLGGGIGAFFIAAMLMGIAMDGLDSVTPGGFRFWPDGAIAAGLIGLAVVIMIFTARVWVLYIAGCLLFAIPKCLVVIVSGMDFNSHPFSRLVASELLLFALASVFLFYRVLRSHCPTLVDRLALTFWVFCFVFGLSRQNPAFVASWQMAGLASLCLAFWLARKKHRRHSLSPARAPE